MKRLIMGLLVLVALLQVRAAELSWMTDLPKAQEKARAENKLVMLQFTGSDWCPGCIQLNKEVLSMPEFAEYAAKNFVPVEVDFPQKKAQSDEVKKANEALLKQYNIRGFPTVIVLDGAGRKLGEFLGYMGGGPRSFIAELEKLKKK